MGPAVKTEQFCGISTSPVWQAWLYQYSQQLYQELAEHLRAGQGCAANRQKMETLLSKIRAQGGEEQLVEFLRREFPHSLERSGQQRPAPPAAVAPVGAVPFVDPDPGLLSYPRRRVLRGTEVDLLPELVSGAASHEVVQVDDAVYLEYVPRSMAAVVNQIPPQNWLIRRWRERK